MLKIKVFNPYYDETYKTKSFDIERWEIFLNNHERGNEEIMHFLDETTNQLVSINPAHFAQVCAMEEEE